MDQEELLHTDQPLHAANAANVIEGQVKRTAVIQCVREKEREREIGISRTVEYHIAGSLRGIQFLQKASLQSFRGLIFTDAHTHAH